MPLLMLAFTIALQAPAQSEAMVQWSRTSTSRDQIWEVRVTDRHIASSPSWSPTSASPPLSPRVAIRSANHTLQRMFADGDQWRVESLGLHRIAVTDVWVYTVAFNPPRRTTGVTRLVSSPDAPFMTVVESGIGPVETLTFVVLMDGRAIAPVSTGPWPPNRRK